MQKGDKVQHKVTKRIGKVHSFSKKHPGWIKVQWEGDDVAFRYEAEELQAVECGREHSEFPGYFCTKEVKHDGWCCCTPRN